MKEENGFTSGVLQGRRYNWCGENLLGVSRNNGSEVIGLKVLFWIRNISRVGFSQIMMKEDRERCCVFFMAFEKDYVYVWVLRKYEEVLVENLG